jgi:alkanesulfonate monooxygenase SsuD/methylene tetrahydromethanopterin reductase-like flavin-dependent oxidoreductase (luciferase family)
MDDMAARKFSANPMHGPNKLKLGVFNINCNGGLTISMAPERWKADWPDVVKATIMADEAGFDFILPVAKWHGYGGKSNNLNRSFETLTHGAALGALTKHAAMFCTVHVTLVTPAFAAKAMATIDHVTNGRAGLNIVCGWNDDEFDMHGVKIDKERRYDQGLEWYKVWSRAVAGGPKFDFDGEFYKLRGVFTDPCALQERMPVLSAGFSRKGREFAGQAADVLFTLVSEIENVPATVGAVRASAAKYGRACGVYTQAQIVCRPTFKEAMEFYHYFAEEMADHEAIEYHRAKSSAGRDNESSYADRPTLNKYSRMTGKRFAGAYPSIYPLIGSPDEIVDEMRQLHAAGLGGLAIVFLNYLDEMPYFNAEVLPRLVRAGLREAHGARGD